MVIDWFVDYLTVRVILLYNTVLKTRAGKDKTDSVPKNAVFNLLYSECQVQCLFFF